MDSTFLIWLRTQPQIWVDSFQRGRIATREAFAAEEENLDEIARHVKAARMIGAGEA